MHSPISIRWVVDAVESNIIVASIAGRDVRDCVRMIHALRGSGSLRCRRNS